MKARILLILGVVITAIIGSGICSQAALQCEETYHSPSGSQKVLVAVNSAIYEAIYQTSLKQYTEDLEAEDYEVILLKFIAGTPREFRDYIKSIPGLKGLVFVGDLLVARFEIANDFSQYGYTSFPCDLYYMDLDGEWLDSDNNGIFDAHNASSGDLGPEIWLGELSASVLSAADMDEVGLLNNYFRKNHAYRAGKLCLPQRALAYVDDDLVSFFGNCNLDLAYSDVKLINEGLMTNAIDYRNRLREGYEWVHVCSHATENGQSFRAYLFAYRDLLHEQGRQVYVGPNDGAEYAWACNVVDDSPNYMCYTPYTTGLSLGKFIRAKFWLKIDDNTGSNEKVAILDVYDNTDKKVLSALDVYRSDFKTPNQNEAFTFDFIAAPGHQLVFRTYWLDKSYLAQDSLAFTTVDSDVLNFDFRDVLALDPQVCFYNLYACYSCRYTYPDNLGGHYNFAKRGGLAVIGSTKAGSIYENNLFYPYLSPAQRNCIGEAFQKWFNSQELEGYYNKSWFYGMTLLGDPTLHTENYHTVKQKEETPWRDNETGTLYTGMGWNYTMGYAFTPLKDGKITKLGGFFQGTKTVYLWDSTQKLLAQAQVTSNNNWSYTAITPVEVKADQTYTVGVYVGAAGGSFRSESSPFIQAYGNIKIETSCYSYGNGFPDKTYSRSMYGQVDIGFIPGNPETPWRENADGSLQTNVTGNSTLGYRFTPFQDGKITQLGGFFQGANMVYLWDSGKRLLAFAKVDSNNNWSYTSIRPVAVKANQTYTVGTYLDGSESSYRSGITPFPRSCGNIRIEAGCYKDGTSAQYPTDTYNNYMYGQVDIGLIPDKAESPWQYYQNGSLAANLSWDYTMGYRFTPLKDGQITKLGGCFKGGKTVYLWDPSQKLLASATVNANNKWNYTQILPVSVKAGQTYTVAVYLGGTGGSYRYYIEQFPQIYENIKIEVSCFAPGNGYPVADYNYAMYGQADIEFVEGAQ